jgi:hypothetical protein
MKLDMSGKPHGEDATGSAAGTYEQGDLECMLEHYLEAKKIEADPALLATVKDYALSKNKMISELFDQPTKNAPPKSLSDLKAKYNSIVKGDDEGDAEDAAETKEEPADKKAKK